MPMILVTGGAGYIGSHTVLQLLLAGYNVLAVDNFDNSSAVAISRVKELAGKLAKNFSFVELDLRNRAALEKVFTNQKFDAVIHFAGLKAVGESVQKPLLYFDNNLIGTIILFQVMVAHGCKKLVFSSSATVYGWPKEVPCTEEFPLSSTNPYGRTKLIIEEMCRDLYCADKNWKIILLRYFNPVGAHPSGFIGEDPRGIPNNLMPFVQQVAVGRLPSLTVFGNDYKTCDGTGVRDYIHVVDLAEGHIAALRKLDDPKIGCEVYNLGTGKGTSVLEMVKAFEQASGKKIPLAMGGRRPGDAEIVYASTKKAEKELNWKTGFDRGSFLAWQDLRVVLPNFGKGPTKRLLNGLNGYAEPGRIMAIMGPSGSGKSTLLDALAGRLSKNVVMTGNVLLNGKKKSLGYGGVAYVTQEDVLLGTLTVKETVSYSAHLRLPTSMSKEEVNSLVDGTIIEMGLQDCADRLIGNWHLRGISGGEKKRLSIALEILTMPRLLFLDEPTSGLDSASAFFVVQTLRNVARDGRTVISSIHQPSSEVFTLFDDLFLLSGGETVYFGEAKSAIEFFAEAGFPCPRKRNPSDHFLRCINSDFDIVTATLKGSQRIHDVPNSADPFMNLATAEIKSMLVEKYRRSAYARRAKTRIQELSTDEGLQPQTQNGSQASWWKQLSTLTKRSFVNMCRDVGYYWLRIIIYIIVSICVGTVYFDIGYSYTSILARGACGAFISGFMTFMSIGGFPSFIEEMKVFYRERLNGYYGVAAYILANFLSSFPFLVAIALTSSTITYNMVKFRPGISHFVFFTFNIYSCISVIESLMMVVASLVPNFLMGIITGAGIIGIMMMTSGFFRLLSDLPKPVWRYPISYISYGSWAIQGAYKNDLLGLEFEPLIPGDNKLTGEYVITHMLGIELNHSKWWDLAALFVILLAYRLLFFTVLKFKERASPLFQTLYAKRTIQQLEKRPSFRKMPSFPSQRHQPLHSLSSQDGLDSPLN